MAGIKKIHIEDFQPFAQHPPVSITLEGAYFRAKLHDSPLSSPTLDGLKADLTARIEVLVADLPWAPVIQLTLHHEGVRNQSDGNPLAAAVSIQIERYHLVVVDVPKDGLDDSRRGSWSGKLSAPWDKTTPKAKMRASKNWYYYFGNQGGSRYTAPRNPDGSLALPCKVGVSGGFGEVHILAYTDETWAGLTALVQSLHDIRAKLRAIAGDAGLLQALSALGAQMLDASRLLPGAVAGSLPALSAGTSVAKASKTKRGKRTARNQTSDFTVEPLEGYAKDDAAGNSSSDAFEAGSLRAIGTPVMRDRD